MFAMMLAVGLGLLLGIGAAQEAVSPGSLRVEVPSGGEIDLDGTLSPGEWETAYRTELAGGGELMLARHGSHLNIGLRGKPRPAASICLLHGDELRVLHSSGALGTAVYRRGERRWERVRQFSWECRETSMSDAARAERSRYLETEGWVASNGEMGAADETEIQIEMPGDELQLSVATIGSPDYEEVSWWPPRLEDGCRSLDLTRGSAPEVLDVSPMQWAVVSAGRYETGAVTDVDGNVYRTIRIGDQWWMAENLRVAHDPKGREIDSYAFDNDPSKGATYGRLYSWDAAMNGSTSPRARGIAPDGWHIPDDEDWKRLIDHLGGASVAGGKMKEAGLDHWNPPNAGATDSSGFTALPAGGFSMGLFEGLGVGTHFWSSTASETMTSVPSLHSESAEVLFFEVPKKFHHSVRCVKD